MIIPGHQGYDWRGHEGYDSRMTEEDINECYQQGREHSHKKLVFDMIKKELSVK